MAKVRYPDVDGSSCGTGNRREPFLEEDPDDDIPTARIVNERGGRKRDRRDTDDGDHLLPLDKLFR